MKSYLLDLNCDLGEGERLARTEALMRWVTSANVACGGHAGSVPAMEACVRLARKHHVNLGAHPGFPDRLHFGRKHIRIHEEDLELLLLQQVGALEKIAQRGGLALHHIKLHGALYHAAEREFALARCYVQTVRRHWPGVRIYARFGGAVSRQPPHNAVEVWCEAFADRAYQANGSLLPREHRGAIHTIKGAVRQVEELLGRGSVLTADGTRLPIQAKTVCVHGDTRNAGALARAVAQVLQRTD